MAMKECELCLNLYEGEIHVHLMRDCTMTCPFDCQVTDDIATVVHFSDPSYAHAHLVSLTGMFLRIQQNQQEMQVKATQSVNSKGMELLLRLLARAKQSKAAMQWFTNNTSKLVSLCEGECAEVGGKSEVIFDGVGNAQLDIIETKNQRRMFFLLENDFLRVQPANRAAIQRFLPVDNRMTELTNQGVQITRRRRAAVWQINSAQLNVTDIAHYTYNGQLVWNIDVTEARDNQYIFTNPFFTHHFGYKQLLKCYPQGNERERSGHVSLFFLLHESQYANLLVWPFEKLVKFTLLNHQSADQDFSKCVRPNRLGLGLDPPKVFNGMGVTRFCPEEYFTDQNLGYNNRGHVNILVEVKDNLDEDVQVLMAEEEVEL